MISSVWRVLLKTPSREPRTAPLPEGFQEASSCCPAALPETVCRVTGPLSWSFFFLLVAWRVSLSWNRSEHLTAGTSDRAGINGEVGRRETGSQKLSKRFWRRWKLSRYKPRKGWTQLIRLNPNVIPYTLVKLDRVSLKDGDSQLPWKLEHFRNPSNIESKGVTSNSKAQEYNKNIPLEQSSLETAFYFSRH